MGRGSDAETKPDWLQLEPGEQFIRAYGGVGVTKQVIGIKLALVGLVLAGVANFYLFDRRSDGQVGADLWPILAVAMALVVFAALFVVFTVVRRRGQAWLTTRMLIVKRGKGYGGIPLGEITRIRTGSGLARRNVEVFTTTGASQVASLCVADPRAAAEELAAYARAAGAKLS
jgi:hypothetical protein